MRFRLTFGRLAVTTVVGGATCLWVFPKHRERKVIAEASITLDAQQKFAANPLPSRAQHMNSLQEKHFDVLVIGGGATGSGVALDAISRGLSTAMVEKFDFSSGTSSRSTKLIHGGVRYLQKAIMRLDSEQYHMVKEALTERGNLMQIAPHLARPLPIMLPIYKYWQLPYYWVGIKMYDLVAGTQGLKPSYVLSKAKALELFPMLKQNRLVGAIVYYDGQHEDARMCLSIVMTAIRMGATIANHTEVLELTKGQNEAGETVLNGARVRDRLTGKEFYIKAKTVVNATGPYTDFVRQLDDKDQGTICQPSSGVHIVLPDYYSPANMGLLDPSTSDGRVIFFLPWEGVTMAGTTDNPCAVTDNPAPSEAEIQFILGEIRNYLNPDVNVRRGDVLSAWSGIRPLVVNPNATDTQSIARNHIIDVSQSNLVTIAGGKWTTYRQMAEETVDTCIRVSGLSPKTPGCVTKGLLLDGAHEWSPTLFIRLIQDFGLESVVAKHLTKTYGDRAIKVARLAQLTGKRWPVVGKRLHEDYPYIEAEVIYGVREYAATAVDMLARRTRLAFINVHAAEESLPRIIEIMSAQLGWSKQREKEEFDRAMRFLHVEMGLNLKEQKDVPINMTKDDINAYMKRFRALDTDNKGFITISDLRTYFKKTGEAITENQLHAMISEVDLNKNAQVDLGEFLQLMSALKSGTVSTSRLAKAAELSEEMTPRISTTRSGGGL